MRSSMRSSMRQAAARLTVDAMDALAAKAAMPALAAIDAIDAKRRNGAAAPFRRQSSQRSVTRLRAIGHHDAGTAAFGLRLLHRRLQALLVQRLEVDFGQMDGLEARTRDHVGNIAA